jgi:hypothetical protein
LMTKIPPIQIVAGIVCVLCWVATNAIMLDIVESLGIRYLAIFPVPPGPDCVHVLDIAFKLVGP